MKKAFKNLLITLLITGLIFPYLGGVNYARAQQDGDYGVTGQYNLPVTLDGAVGYISGYAPAINELPLCKEGLKNTLKNLFSAKDPTVQVDNPSYSSELDLSSITDSINFSANPTRYNSNDFEEQVAETLNQSDSVPTYDETANKKLDEQKQQLEEIQGSTEALEQNDTCLKSIGRMVTKMLLQKITLSTVNWIQNGFEGGPSFLTNPGEFFEDLARTQILQFGLEIDNPNLYPFGRDFVRRQAVAFNSSFAQRARYTLNDLIREKTPQYSAQTFQTDFSQGGWNAWLAMTQVPANNPLGFELIAGEELAQRIEEENQEIQRQLQQGDGYLGDRRCADPKGITIEQHRAALINGQKEDVTANIDGQYQVVGQYVSGTCRRWEYVTPGQIISEAATSAINYPNEALLRADDLNDAVAAVIDALLSQFSTQLINRGFANLPTTGSDGSYLIDGNQYGNNYLSTQTQLDYGPYANSSNWLRKHHDFDIRTDLTQSFIDIQRTYSGKLEEYNELLKALIRNTYQLDYCIPGPSPDWQNRAYGDLSEVAKTIPNTPGGTVAMIKGLFAMLKGINVGFSFGFAFIAKFDVSVNLNLGNITEGVLSMLGEGLPEEVMTRYYYTTILIAQTGLRVAPSAQIESKGDVVNIIGEMISGYDKAVKTTFNPGVMPEITNLAASEYRKVRGYKNLILSNKDEIARINSTVATLYRIRDELGPNYPLPPDYDFGNDVDVLNTFARVSSNLVDGDDVGYVERLIGRTKDTIDYVYEDLLTGPNGCHCTLDEQLEEETDRMPYPVNEFVPFPGMDYVIMDLFGQNVSSLCGASDTYEPLECLPPWQEINGECIYQVPATCVPPPTQACDEDPETPAPDCEPQSAPAGCWNNDFVNPETNPYDPNYGLVDLECDDNQISINGICVDETTYDMSSGDFQSLLNTLADIYDDENGDVDSELTEKIENYIDDLAGNIGCTEDQQDTKSDELFAEIQDREKVFAFTNPGFLSHGYYDQTKSSNPYQNDFRSPPYDQDEDGDGLPDALPNQTVYIGYGILNLSKQCPALTFGPNAKKATARSTKERIKSCEKEYKNNSGKKTECIKDVVNDAKAMMDRSCAADLTIKTICKGLKTGDLGSYTDSVRRFEKIMRIY